MNIKTRYDAVIVGGGHNGLVAATYLARAGQSVLLLERNDELGGATASERVFPGMDARLSRYSYLVSLLSQTIVRDLELPFSCRRRSIFSCAPYERDGRARALLMSNVDKDRSQMSFEALAGTDWNGYQGLLELERTFATRVWPSLLEPLRSRQEWMGSLETPMLRAAWDALVERPLGETIERHVQNDLVRGVIFTDAKVGVFTWPHDPTLLQNRCFILHVIGQGTGEWQVPVGGMGALVQALIAASRQAGAELLTGSPVEAIHTGKPYHTVVFRQGDRERAVEATRVLVNAGPQVFARSLGEQYAPAPGDEGSVCKVNMLLRRLPRLRAEDIDPRDAFAGTFRVDEGYEQMQLSYRQAEAGEIPERPPSEVYCHTLTDDSILGPDLRDSGYHSLTLFGLDMPYRLFEEDNDVARAEALRRYLDRLNRVLAEPIEECLARDANGNLCVEAKTPIDLEREIALNRGNIFHGELSWFFTDDAGQVGTWGVETPYERIYRCGSSAQRGGAVSGIPGHNAAQRIFEELHITRPLVRA
jgi:phytoene dehydrogenase-like protein